MISSKTKIGLLLAAHVVGGLFLAGTARPATGAFPIALFGLFALVFAEAGLIGIWGGLSAIRLVFRHFAVLVATLYLWAVFVVVSREGTNYFLILLLVALTVVPIIVVLSCLRHSRRRLRLAHLIVAMTALQFLLFEPTGLVKGNDELKPAAEKLVEIMIGQLKTLKTKKSDWLRPRKEGNT